MTDKNETHYIINGKPYVRVTALLRARGLVDFSKIPENDRQYYMDRGTANHKLWQDVEEGTADGFDYDARVEAYRAAHARFLRETGFRSLPGGIEMRVQNDDFMVAGTLDRIGTIQNRVVLLDYKTTSVHPATALQTAIYLLCIPGYKFHEVERYGVAFRDDGTYRFSNNGKPYPLTDQNDALYHLTEYRKENAYDPAYC